MVWKDLLKLVLSAILPMAYVTLKNLYPDFPLSQDGFVQTVLWAVGLLIGGWNLHEVLTKYLWRKEKTK